MCLGIPMKITHIDGETGTVIMEDTEYEVSLAMVPEAQVGEYVIVHAGYAIEKLDEEAAQETLDIFREFTDLE